jgi:hypothetical protein
MHARHISHSPCISPSSAVTQLMRKVWIAIANVKNGSQFLGYYFGFIGKTFDGLLLRHEMKLLYTFNRKQRTTHTSTHCERLSSLVNFTIYNTLQDIVSLNLIHNSSWYYTMKTRMYSKVHCAQIQNNFIPSNFILNNYHLCTCSLWNSSSDNCEAIIMHSTHLFHHYHGHGYDHRSYDNKSVTSSSANEYWLHL